MHVIITGFSHTGFLIFLLFISVEMALEKTIKDLQAQNTQFQQVLMNLAKGREDLKTLFTKESKKKKMSVTLNVRRRSKGHAQLDQKEDAYFKEEDSQEEEARN